MRDNGMNGQLDTSHPLPTRQAFLDNFHKLRKEEKIIMAQKMTGGTRESIAFHNSQI